MVAERCLGIGRPSQQVMLCMRIHFLNHLGHGQIFHLPSLLVPGARPREVTPLKQQNRIKGTIRWTGGMRTGETGVRGQLRSSVRKTTLLPAGGKRSAPKVQARGRKLLAWSDLALREVYNGQSDLCQWVLRPRE